MKRFIQCVVLLYLFGLLYGRSITEDTNGIPGKLEHLDDIRQKRQGGSGDRQRRGRKGRKGGKMGRLSYREKTFL